MARPERARLPSSGSTETRVGRASLTSTTLGYVPLRPIFGTYGPATPAHIHYWLGDGLGAGRKRIEAWIARSGDHLARVEIDGLSAYVLREDLGELAATPATDIVRLLPGYDQWVLGPGANDVHVVPPRQRGAVSRNANIVIAGGVVGGTWSLTKDSVTIALFEDAARQPRDALTTEVARLASILARPLEPDVHVA